MEIQDFQLSAPFVKVLNPENTVTFNESWKKKIMTDSRFYTNKCTKISKKGEEGDILIRKRRNT